MRQIELEPCDDSDDDEPLCPYCAGSGEGMADGTTCCHCRGHGVERRDLRDYEPDACDYWGDR